jgi:hypothetical protein
MVLEQDMKAKWEHASKKENSRQIGNLTFDWLVPNVASSETALSCPYSNIIWKWNWF